MALASFKGNLHGLVDHPERIRHEERNVPGSRYIVVGINVDINSAHLKLLSKEN